MKRSTLVLVIMALGLSACGGGDGGDAGAPSGTAAATGLTGDAVAGADIFAGTCVACHGPEGRGIVGLGKDLHNNEFVASKTDDEMVAFIKVGRPADDPLNTTGVDMLPRGGNESLTDQDLYDVVAFIRTLD